MSVIISPIITNAGLGVFAPSATGIEFTFTHVAVGTGTSVASAANTALENEIARFPIAGGGMVTGGQAVSINALITNHANANPQNYDITELGFYGVDGASNTVLFAIYRQNTPLIGKVSGADIAAPFVLGLAALPVNNMTVQIDTNTSQALALMGQHTASSHPHTQYKRTLDNSERLKIATAVDVDEAIRKDELDALRLRLIANGVDANLAATNHLPDIDVDSFLTPEGYFDIYTLGDKPFAYGICKTWKEYIGVVYQFAQSSANGDFATRLYRDSVGYWTNWRYYASLNGDANQQFHVNTATSDTHAPTFKQLNDAITGVSGSIPIIPPPVDISGKANLAGSSTQLFSAADGTNGKEVVNFDQLNAMLNRVWPIGSIYENSISNQNPADPSLLGFGVWVATQAGRFSVGYQAGDSLFGVVGNEGGARDHKMTINNLIQHEHDRNADGLEESVNVYTSGTDSGHYSPGASYLKLYTKTGKTGLADPEAIPTLPPYHVSYKWIRIA